MLRKLTKTLKSDNMVVLLGNLLASACGLVSFMLLARFLSKSAFGEWAIFISATGLVELMKTGLVRQALVKELSSGKSDQENKITLSSAWFLTIGLNVSLAAIVAFVGLFIDNKSLVLFFDYYPLFSLLGIAGSFSTWLAHAKGLFWEMNIIRVISNVLFLFFIGLIYFFGLELRQVVYGYLLATFISSIYGYFRFLSTIRFSDFSRERMQQLLAFGKHSFATLTGANLLKSADSLIIGGLMGTEAVAIYAIPLKVLDVLEIPLRGFVMTSFRKLVGFHSQQNIRAFRHEIVKNIRSLSILFFSGALVIFFMPRLVIEMLGGAGYEESVALLQLFLIPAILLPLDKFIGISLDAANLPRLNAIKVWIMVLVNVIGDVVVIYLFDALWAVALVTILNIVVGIAFGVFVNPVFRMGSNKIYTIKSMKAQKFATGYERS
ncbi:MAG: oligosaccharide flippase family protein [Cyclobacteriaceae bacterium]